MNNPFDTSFELLGNDLVINEDSCNLCCEYCLTGQSNLKENHAEQLIFSPQKGESYQSGTPFAKKLHIIAERVRTGLKTPLIKLTGGEIFIIKGILDFIEEISSDFAVVVLQSNALPLTDSKIKRLSEIDNIVVQVTLDSHKYEGNSYRVRSPELHEKLLKRIEAIVNAGIPVEIYSVLHDRSVEHYREFAAWCNSFPKNKPQLLPFPVRGPDIERFNVQASQYPFVEKFVDIQTEYPEVMPPIPYLERLVSFYLDAGRTWRCHLPRLVISTFSDGVTTACPNIWFNDMGDLTDGDGREIIEKVGKSAFYEILLAKKPRLDACRGCFTPWDTLSLYYEDQITIDELCQAPSYSTPAIREFLIRKKEEYISSEGAISCTL